MGIIVLGVIVGGVYMAKSTPDEAMMTDQDKDSALSKSGDQAAMDADAKRDKEAMEKEKSMSTEGTTTEKKGESMMSAGSYEAYTPEKILTASNEHHVVLFFRASWCPSCRAVDADIKAHMAAIPPSLTILDVNYDDSTALKQKYGVTYQHTFVQVDAKGTMIKKWQGSPTLSALVAEIR